MTPSMRRAVAIIWCAGACAPATRPAPGSEVVSVEGSAPVPTDLTLARGASLPARRAQTAYADSLLRTMSLRDKAAQLVWPWILGDFVPENSAEWRRVSRLVTEQHVGGFIMSLGSPVDIAVKINALQRLSTVPLLMSADLETGVGFRARGGYFTPNAVDLGGATNFPLQMALGASGDSALAYELGRVTAREGRAIGLHIAYGPVLDVNNNPNNPVIGARSISEDPQVAARLGAAVVRGLQENGMLATGKHFPGHGDTETNSHLALSAVTAPRARLDSVELVPFRAAIAAGVGAMMTFHGYLPALDSALVPATLSSKVMTTLLREQLKFNGLLITDAMDMAGVVDGFGATRSVQLAVAAGADLILMPADIGAAIDAIVAGVTAGMYTEERLSESVRRLLVLKHQFGLHRTRLVPIEGVRQLVGDSTHIEAARRVASRGFVLARDDAGLVPIATGTSKPKTLSITYARRTDLGAGVTFDAELRRWTGPLTTLFVNADDPSVTYDRALTEAAAADVVLVNSYANISSESATAAAPRAFVEFVNRLLSQGSRVVLTSFGTPYLLNQLPNAKTYAIAWGGTGASQRAAALALVGENAITATLPISIPGVLSRGAGVARARVTR